MLTKIAISKFDPILWEKMTVGGGLGALHFLCHLKRVLELLVSVRVNPLAIFSDNWVNTITAGKKQKTNKQTRIRDLSSGKNKKIHLFVDWNLKLLQ